MTRQISDALILDGESYFITAVDGEGLFQPDRRGLVPQGLSTACHRGFVCRYEVIGGRLVLRDLEIGLREIAPPLDGVQPTKDKYGAWHYAGLAITVGFSGRLLIGRDDVPRPPYLNMGFAPAWLYRVVVDLTFENGQLHDRRDRSRELAVVRQRLGEAGAKPRDGESIGDWVTRTFSLSYAYSWPDPPDR